MLIEGTKILALPRAEVWRALNDPAFLQSVIPGCRKVAEPAPGQLVMALTAAVGPIKASFDVEMQKLEVVAPESYVLAGRGSAGVAGSASGRARLRLTEVQGGTQLDYSAETEITGRVAQLGARMIDSTARKFSEEFFANVARAMGGYGAQPQPGSETDAPPAAAGIQAVGLIPQSPAGVIAAPAVPDALNTVISRLMLDGLAWRLALGCAAGSFVGMLAAAAVLRGWT